MKGTLKILLGLVIIFCAVSLFNRIVLMVSKRYINDGQFYTARIITGAVITFDPFLYIPHPVYRDHLTDINTRESIRRFTLFHPISDTGNIDTEHIDNRLYDEFRGYDFGDLWKGYMSIISAYDTPIKRLI